jgi:hypothetical protein
MTQYYRESLMDIRTTVQQCTLERYPHLTLNDIEPYTRQCCRDLWELAWKPTATARAEVKPTVARYPAELARLHALVPVLRADFDARCGDKRRGDERYRQHLPKKGFTSAWQASYLGAAHGFVMEPDALRPTTLAAIGARVHAGIFLLKYDTRPAPAVFTGANAREGYRYRRLLWLAAMGLAEGLSGQALALCEDYFRLEGHILRALIGRRLLAAGERPKRGRFPWNDRTRAITDGMHAAFLDSEGGDGGEADPQEDTGVAP